MRPHSDRREEGPKHEVICWGSTEARDSRDHKQLERLLGRSYPIHLTIHYIAKQGGKLSSKRDWLVALSGDRFNFFC